MIDRSSVKRAVERFKTRSDYEFFFSRITSPEWLLPLLEEGFFLNPPPVIRSENSVQFPPWPESRYLVRMAKEHTEDGSQNALLAVLEAVPETDNDSVLNDLAEAALCLPPALSVEWVRNRAIPMIDARTSLFYGSEELAQIAIGLAESGMTGPALGIIERLLKIYPDPRPEEERPFSIGTPRTKLRDWDFERIAERYVPAVIARCSGPSAPGVRVVSRILDEALDIKRAPGEDRPDDYSYIWLKRIENAEESHDQIVKSLIVALRDGCSELIANEPERLGAVVNALEDREPLRSIFERLSLFLIRVHVDIDIELVRTRLLDRHTLWEFSTWREFGQLLQTAYTKLEDDDKRLILDHVLGEPPARENDDDEADGEEHDEEALNGRIRRWRQRVLSAIPTDLPAREAQLLDELVAEFGPLEDPLTLLPESSTWVGPTSPMSEDELAEMSVTDIHEYLLTWTPPEDWHAPSPEGLGRVLEQVAKVRAGEFADKVNDMRDLDPTYVRCIISGLRQAVEGGTSIDWDDVLGYARWIVDQGQEVEVERVITSDPNDRDPNWSWTRKQVASLLEAGFKDMDAQIPQAHRQIVWEILEPLTQDPEPTPEYEDTYGGSNTDALTLSINTVRGEAMHAVVRYALWLRRHLLDIESSQPTFQEMPEVEEILDAHLDPDFDPSLAIRAVYGQWFPQLFVVDPEWSRNNSQTIFSTDEPQRERGRAAWRSYLWAQPPYSDLFEILRWRYVAAVDDIGTGDETGRRYDEDRRLGRHVASYYWRGLIHIEDDLMQSFISTAPDELRGYVILFIGLEAGNWIDDGKLQPVIDRLVTLADDCLQRARVNPENHTEELAGFGSWYVSGKFEKEWILEFLTEATRISRKVERVGEVLERLAADAREYPELVVRCIRHIVEGDETNWIARAHEDHIRQALNVVLESDDVRAKERARNFIDYLGARGQRMFFDLL